MIKLKDLDFIIKICIFINLKNVIYLFELDWIFLIIQNKDVN